MRIIKKSGQCNNLAFFLFFSNNLKCPTSSSDKNKNAPAKQSSAHEKRLT